MHVKTVDVRQCDLNQPGIQGFELRSCGRWLAMKSKCKLYSVHLCIRQPWTLTKRQTDNKANFVGHDICDESQTSSVLLSVVVHQA